MTVDESNSQAASAAEVAEAFSAGSDALREKMKEFAAGGDATFRDAADRSMKAMGELGAQSKSNLEAVMASVAAATRGAESLGAQAMVYAKSSVEGHVAAAKALSGARSVQEVVELQTAYARKAMESYLAEMNRASETLAGVMKETVKPLSERAAAAAEAVQSAR